MKVFHIEERIKCPCGKNLDIKFDVKAGPITPHGIRLYRRSDIDVKEVKK